jgi:CubicO group peptidase (beta-lactamase class C family)
MQDTEKLILDAIASNIFPGAVLSVSLKGEVVFHEAYGMADIFSGTQMTTQTIFDLASLTKPLATTLALMLLVQEDRIGLDQPIVEILSGLAAGKKRKITVRQLLCHTSGMPDWRPWFIPLLRRPSTERKKLLQQLLTAEPLYSEPGSKTLYSDLGFMLLEWIIEEVGGDRLDRFVQQAVYKPLGIADLFYCDLQKAGEGEFAATQLCPWRGRLLKGQVDDDNTWAMGGISGQAGLFGTASAVSTLLNRLLMTGGNSGCFDLFAPRIVTRFFQRQALDGRALGFDTPARPGSSSGQFFAASSVGHLGFTGTSFWADPERSLVVVLLTNRVHPFRFAGGIKTFRPILHDTAVQELGLV